MAGSSSSGDSGSSTTGTDTGMGFNGPSFSNASDVARIKDAVENSRAEQTTSGRGIARDEEEDSPSKKESELGEKEGLDEKEKLGDKGSGLEEKPEKSDAKPEEGKGENNGGVKDKLNGLNPLNKLKGKFSIAKLKMYLTIGGIALAVLAFFFVVLAFICIFTGILGDGSDDYGEDDEETIIKDTYNNEYDEYPDYCSDENGNVSDDCVVLPPEEKEEEGTTDNTTDGTETGEEETTNDGNPGNSHNSNNPGNMENIPMEY